MLLSFASNTDQTLQGSIKRTLEKNDRHVENDSNKKSKKECNTGEPSKEDSSDSSDSESESGDEGEDEVEDEGEDEGDDSG
jgi:hypothetical protein